MLPGKNDSSKYLEFKEDIKDKYVVYVSIDTFVSLY